MLLPQIPGIPVHQVPDLTEPHVLTFCSEVSSECQPLYLQSTPESGGKLEDCFNIVEQKVRSSCGECVYGWLIAELPEIMIEAVFHAVWKDQGGVLHDISPQTGLNGRQLFLPDPTREYSGRQVNNVRKPLRDDPAIRRFIRANDRHFELMNKGDRAEQHGGIAIPKEELAPVMAEIMEATMGLIGQVQQAEHNTPLQDKYEPCNCGSGLKFKWCCGKKR